ncbi:MAG: 50S ribosomal protein L23 [Clostridiales bacterium]|nr:50S ribosomal protein L23 [Candidatus Apopatousia equi]
MRDYDIIIKPILTEKSYADIANKRYTFMVAKDANKVEIKKAIENIFKVTVAKVNTLNVQGKLKSQDRGRTYGFTASYKKAIVTLTADSKSIEFFDSLS